MFYEFIEGWVLLGWILNLISIPLTILWTGWLIYIYGYIEVAKHTEKVNTKMYFQLLFELIIPWYGAFMLWHGLSVFNFVKGGYGIKYDVMKQSLSKYRILKW